MTDEAASSHATKGAASDRQALQELQSRIDGLDHRTEEQHAFISGMKYISTMTYMSTEATIDAFIELFPPEVLCNPFCLKLQILYVSFRDLLQLVGITVDRRRGLYIPLAIVNSVYESDNILRNAATTLISDFKHAANHIVTSDSTRHATESGAIGNDTESFWRRVDNANRRFSEKERYSGILAESPNLMEVRKAYKMYCNQKDSPRPDRVSLISSILKGPALNFWMERIDGNPNYSKLGGVFKALETQFDTPAHQKQIEMLAQSMTIEDTMKNHHCSRIAALGILYHEVSRLNEQFRKVKRVNAFKTQTLMKIVERYQWSHTAEEEVMQDKLSYDSLYIKLSSSIVIWENEAIRVGKNPESADDRRPTSTLIPSFTGFGEQYAYSRPFRRPTIIRQQPRRTPREDFRSPLSPQPTTRPKLQSHCFRGGKTGHWRAECSLQKTASMISAVRARMKELGGPPDQAAAQILFELTVEEDNHTDIIDDNDNTFEALVLEHPDGDLVKIYELGEQEEPRNETPSQDFQKAGGQ